MFLERMENSIGFLARAGKKTGICKNGLDFDESDWVTMVLYIRLKQG